LRDPEKEVERSRASRAPTHNEYVELPASSEPHNNNTHYVGGHTRHILPVLLCIGYSRVLVTSPVACKIFQFDAAHSSNSETNWQKTIYKMGLARFRW